jgi:hypothetical protein
MGNRGACPWASTFWEAMGASPKMVVPTNIFFMWCHNCTDISNLWWAGAATRAGLWQPGALGWTNFWGPLCSAMIAKQKNTTDCVKSNWSKEAQLPIEAPSMWQTFHVDALLIADLHYLNSYFSNNYKSEWLSVLHPISTYILSENLLWLSTFA